jgi:hypothetical protein
MAVALLINHQVIMTRSLLIVAAVVLSACGGSDTAPSLALFAGSYTLTSINGTALPAKRTDGLTVKSGTLLVNANGAFQFSEETVERSPAIESADGVCSVTSATTISCKVTALGGDPFTGTLSANTLSLATSDGVKLYTRS